jgi:2-polyprenyl-3-methyl-5-hydroxy-6-metoxy-1,4-benzoquinol methylase
MSNGSILDDHKSYYNERWQHADFINSLKLERCIAILESIRALSLFQPRIIDLGCGTGWFTSILAQIGPTVGVDLSDVAIEAARQKYPHVKFIQADLRNWDHNRFGQYDLVISQEVIEHFDAQDAYLQLAFELLRPEGHLILTTPNAKTFEAMPREQRESWSGQPVENLLNAIELRKLAESYFEIISIRSIIPAFGSKGIYRLFSSVRIKNLAQSLGLSNFMKSLRLRMGLGLHLVMVGKKKS